MSIFPEWAKSKEAVTPAKAGVQSSEPENNALDSSVRWNDNDGSSSKAHKPKPHRFDTFALRMAAGMITAIRVSLAVFSSPDKERWPTCRLLDYLKGAEGLARDMLREIALKIFISPAKLRKRSEQGQVIPAANPAEYGPYFRLGVKPAKEDSPEHDAQELSRDSGEYEQGDSADAPSYAQRSEEAASSILDKRRQALEDVLTHPGKHAARMARVLYRADHGPGERLLAKSETDHWLDAVNGMLSAHLAGDADGFAAMMADAPALDTS